MPDAPMIAWTILVDGKPFSVEFGRTEKEAIERYAAGSIFGIERLAARQGAKQGRHALLPL